MFGKKKRYLRGRLKETAKGEPAERSHILGDIKIVVNIKEWPKYEEVKQDSRSGGSRLFCREEGYNGPC